MKDDYENNDIKKKIMKIEKEIGIEFIQCVKRKNEHKRIEIEFYCIIRIRQV